MTAINQIKLVETKIRLYNKPFIEADFLQKVLDKFAPNYKPYQLSAKWLISIIKNGSLYKNNLYSGYVSRYEIIALYMRWTDYMIGGLFAYNQYGFSTQLPNRRTVYNTTYSGRREIAGANIIFRRVRPSFFRGKQKKTSQGIPYYIMSRERALIQLLLETKGNLEFRDDVIYQIDKWNIDPHMLLTLSQTHLNRSQQFFITQFVSWLSK
jgi:hypothetical protein